MIMSKSINAIKCNCLRKTLTVAMSVGALAVAMTQTAQANVDCSEKAASNAEAHLMPGAGYWMQSVDINHITYTSVGGISSYLFNLETEKLEPITRGMDAFPIPPGDIYVHPTGGGGYSFYKMGDGETAKPIFNDTDHFGVYQAVGLLPATKGPKDRVVRVSAGWGAGIFQDYHITTLEDGTYDFKRLHSHPVQVCRNLDTGGLDTQIPVLSRNGELIAGRDTNDQMTKIYKITNIHQVDAATDTEVADCEEVQTIPTETSKISFSFDNKKVMFVIADPITGKGRLLEMDIETAKLTTLSMPSEDVMYMTYRADSSLRNDDRLLYSRRTDAVGVESELILIKPNSVAKDDDELARPLEALGHLWGRACGMDLDTDAARAAGSRVNQNQCDELLNAANFASLPAEYSDLQKDQIQTLCKLSERAQKN